MEEEKTIWLPTEKVGNYRPFIHVWKDGSVSLGIKRRESKYSLKDGTSGQVYFMPLTNILNELALSLGSVLIDNK